MTCTDAFVCNKSCRGITEVSLKVTYIWRIEKDGLKWPKHGNNEEKKVRSRRKEKEGEM